mmetsp:Transcript_6578/g.16151  ORF Transcript_6578/g.16151 Transcript_6578/m.16151 type:complete len:230 (+) Transcript_6578:86-775(+)
MMSTRQAALATIEAESTKTLERMVVSCSQAATPFQSRRLPLLPTPTLTLCEFISMKKTKSCPNFGFHDPSDDEDELALDADCNELDAGFGSMHPCGRSEDDQTLHNFTTLILQNLPRRMSQKILMMHLDAAGLSGCYDYCYLPVDFSNGTSRGFALVNFASPALAAEFIESWSGSQTFCCKGHKKALVVGYSNSQGCAALKSRKRSFRRQRRIRNPEFRPYMTMEPLAN